MLAVHVGMRVRLQDVLDKNKTSVKDAECEIVRIESHAVDHNAMEQAMLLGA